MGGLDLDEAFLALAHHDETHDWPEATQDARILAAVALEGETDIGFLWENTLE